MPSPDSGYWRHLLHMSENITLDYVANGGIATDYLAPFDGEAVFKLAAKAYYAVRLFVSNDFLCAFLDAFGFETYSYESLSSTFMPTAVV